MKTCDICELPAMDSLKPEYKPDGIEQLCSDHTHEIYDFEAQLISINQDRATKGLITIPKHNLVKAKAVCMLYGLDIQISEPKPIKNKYTLAMTVISVLFLSVLFLLNK